MGYDLARQRRVRAAENLARFRSNYGVGPGAISAAFHQLQETEIAEAKIDKPNSFYFLIAMPSIGFVFITRKSRWPAFFVQTTMARHPGRSVAEGISQNLQVNQKPKELWVTRPEYKAYPLNVFRDHIQQELRARRERPYWMARRAEKEAEKAKSSSETKKTRSPPTLLA